MLVRDQHALEELQDRPQGAREITGKHPRQAAERGWKVPDEIRADALCRIAELLESPGLTPRALASILRTLVAFDRTDMLDEKLTLDRVKWAAGQPKETVETAAALLGSENFWGHALASGRAFGASLLLSCAGGVAIGLALGAHRFSGAVAAPMLTALYTIPKVTLYPMVLLVFGLGISAKVAFGVMHGIIPVAIFTMNGVRNIHAVYFRAARAMRLASPR